MSTGDQALLAFLAQLAAQQRLGSGQPGIPVASLPPPGVPVAPLAQPGIPVAPLPPPGVPVAPLPQPGVPVAPLPQPGIPVAPVIQPGVPVAPISGGIVGPATLTPSLPAAPIAAPATPTSPLGVPGTPGGSLTPGVPAAPLGAAAAQPGALQLKPAARSVHSCRRPATTRPGLNQEKGTDMPAASTSTPTAPYTYQQLMLKALLILATKLEALVTVLPAALDAGLKPDPTANDAALQGIEQMWQQEVEKCYTFDLACLLSNGANPDGSPNVYVAVPVPADSGPSGGVPPGGGPGPLAPAGSRSSRPLKGAIPAGTQVSQTQLPALLQRDRRRRPAIPRHQRHAHGRHAGRRPADADHQYARLAGHGAAALLRSVWCFTKHKTRNTKHENTWSATR